jgi:hypothetical protein
MLETEWLILVASELGGLSYGFNYYVYYNIDMLWFVLFYMVSMEEGKSRREHVVSIGTTVRSKLMWFH